MNNAKIEKSPRLQRVHDLLKDGLEYSTLDIVLHAQVCAVSACVAELRANGFDIKCRREGDLWLYKMACK